MYNNLAETMQVKVSKKYQVLTTDEGFQITYHLGFFYQSMWGLIHIN